MKTIDELSRKERRGILDRDASTDDAEDVVKEIVTEVKSRGDEAVEEYTEKFDGYFFEGKSIEVKEGELETAGDKVEEDVLEAIQEAAGNIREFHEKQLESGYEVEVPGNDGVTVGREQVALGTAGLYVPGGGAAYPSTALMTAVPAKVAGVERVVAASPPPINSVTLAALNVAGVDEVYRMGGAQAVAAFGYGTEKVEPVDCIVGPGNVYVTAAKKQVRDDAGVKIEFPAGPSEIGVVANGDAHPEYVAADVLAQLEHDPNSRGVVTATNEKFASELENEIKRQMESMERQETAEKAEYNVLVGGKDDCVEFMCEYAPEHLSLVLGDREEEKELLSEIPTAGSVFLGSYSPVALGDYASGTNHVLPTMGWAKLHGGLSVDDFMKTFTYQRASREGLKDISDVVTTLARVEGLKKHADSVEIRFDE
ncbi:MAG: histidinol dehydrogenase [Halobacteria archaeon]